MISNEISKRLGGRLRSRCEKIWRTCWTVSAGVFFPQSHFLKMQKPKRQKRKRHMVMPANPTADFIVGKTRFALGFLKELFDSVTLGVNPNEILQRHVRAGVGKYIPGARFFLDALDHDQSLFGAYSPVESGTHLSLNGPDFQRSLFSVTNRESLPARRRPPIRPGSDLQEGRLFLAALPGAAAPGTARIKVAHQGIRRDVQDVTFVVVPEPRAKLACAAELVVTSYPTVRDFMRVLLEHVNGNLPFLAEFDVPGHVAFLPALAVRDPVLRQIETPVNRPVALVRSVCQIENVSR